MDMPNSAFIVMRYNSYTVPGKPVHTVLSFIEHAQDDLLSKLTQHHGGWNSLIPGNSFVYQDENKVMFALLAQAPNAMAYRFVKEILTGLEMWVRRWSEGSQTVPGTDIAALYNHTSPLATGRLFYTWTSAHEVANA